MVIIINYYWFEHSLIYHLIIVFGLASVVKEIVLGFYKIFPVIDFLKKEKKLNDVIPA